MEPTTGPLEAFKALHRIQEIETGLLTLLDRLFEMRVEIVTAYYDGPEPKEPQEG